MPFRAAAFLLVAVTILLFVAPSSSQQSRQQNSNRLIVTLQPSSDDQRAALSTFEKYAQAVLSGDYAGARNVLDPGIAKQVSEGAMRARYRLFEAQNGTLQGMSTDGMWLGKPSPNRMAIIVVTHDYESKSVQFSYTLHETADGWKLLGFTEGGRTPAGMIVPTPHK